MYEPLPRMPLHLASRASRLGDLAEALYGAIDDVGLRLPSRRDISRHAQVSEATVSRRLRDASHTEELVASVLASARAMTYPPGLKEEGWSRWVPESDVDLQDVRVWIECLAMATQAPSVSEAVRSAWEHEHRELVRQLTGEVHWPDHPCAPEIALDAQLLLALLLGLSIRRVLDPEVTSEHASASLLRMVAALGHAVE